MRYQIDDYVVHPAHGVGRIVGLVMQRFTEPEARLYYQIAIQRNTTVWVPVDRDLTIGLRPSTPKAELKHYREVLRSRPVSLILDNRQRHFNLADRLKVGLFQDLCEVVRDLNARRWLKPLNELDSRTFRTTHDALCAEWAVAAEVSVPEAAKEVNALLFEAQQAYQK